jgi:hypothetical protein
VLFLSRLLAVVAGFPLERARLDSTAEAGGLLLPDHDCDEELHLHLRPCQPIQFATGENLHVDIKL